MCLQKHDSKSGMFSTMKFLSMNSITLKCKVKILLCETEEVINLENTSKHSSWIKNK